METVLRVTVRVCCLVALAAAIVWNVRCAAAGLLAERGGLQGQPPGLWIAMRLMPANGAYAAEYADLVYASDPTLALRLLKTSVRLNPYDAASWIQLGLLLEAQGDTAAAESALLRAAGADKTFLPAWTLSNYYFRRRAGDRFWSWARQAAQMAPDDATPLLRLAWYESPNAMEIENRLQLQRPAMEAQLLRFVVAQREPQAVSQVAGHLLTRDGSEAFQPLLTQAMLDACDWLLAAHRPELALPLWQGMAARGLVTITKSGLTNGDFSRPPMSQGFDWRLPQTDGVSSFFNTGPNALGFEMTPSAPESFTLLRQTVPVALDTAYRLTIRYESSGILPESGLTWTISDSRTGRLLTRTADLYAPENSEKAACFVAPHDDRFVEIALTYQRAAGTVHPEGKLTLSAVRLTRTADCS